MRSFPAPTRRSLFFLLLTLWQISNTAVRTLVWSTIREGAIDLRSHSRALRMLAVGGLLLIIGFLFSILFNDLLRFNGPLELLANDSTATRGLLAPIAAVPITLIAVTLGWGFVLAGALHTRPALRWSVFGVYCIFGLLPMSNQFNPEIAGTLVYLVPVLLLLLIIAFIVLPRVEWPLAVEWCLVLALHAGIVLIALSSVVRFQRLTDDPWVSNMLSSLVQGHFFFTMPFLVISGLGWVDFGLSAGGWAAKAIERHAAGLLVALILLALLGFRLYSLISGALSDGVAAEQWSAWAGAALFCVGLVPLFLWRQRQASDQGVPQKLLITLAALLPLLQILLFFSLQVATVAILLGAITPDITARVASVQTSILNLSELELQHRGLILALVGFVIVWLGRRRSNPSLVAYGGILAWSQLLAWLMRYGRPLAPFRYEYADVDAVMLVILTGLALFWLLKRQLTAGRALHMLAIAILLALLNQTAFLDNPFSPLFGFAGVFFLVFGIVWNILTAGGSYINSDSNGFPRASRLLLYIGYVLLSVSTAHWYLVSHNLEMQISQATINELGYLVLGLPLAYLMVVEAGAPLLAE